MTIAKNFAIALAIIIIFSLLYIGSKRIDEDNARLNESFARLEMLERDAVFLFEELKGVRAVSLSAWDGAFGKNLEEVE